MTDLGTSIFIDLTGEYADKIPPAFVSGSGTSDCSTITLIFDMDMVDPSVAHMTDYLRIEDAESFAMEHSGSRYGADFKTYEITCIAYPDRVTPVTVRYTGTNITSLSGVLLLPFTAVEISIPKSK